MMQLVFQGAVILFLVYWAGRKRLSCTWTKQETNRYLWTTAFGILLTMVLPVSIAINPGSPLALFTVLMQWICVYTLSKAIYRKNDLRTSRRTPDEDI
jgi:type III secretory pathway component EscV